VRKLTWHFVLYCSILRALYLLLIDLLFTNYSTVALLRLEDALKCLWRIRTTSHQHLAAGMNMAHLRVAFGGGHSTNQLSSAQRRRRPCWRRPGCGDGVNAAVAWYCMGLAAVEETALFLFGCTVENSARIICCMGASSTGCLRAWVRHGRTRFCFISPLLQHHTIRVPQPSSIRPADADMLFCMKSKENQSADAPRIMAPATTTRRLCVYGYLFRARFLYRYAIV